jgi:cytochrome P450
MERNALALNQDEDITSPAFYTGTRHWRFWAQARRTEPIAWVQSERVGGFWSVTTHDLANQVLRKPALFTSAQGMRLGSSPTSVDMAADRMLVVSDGDAHKMLRAAHSSWFNGRAISAFTPDLVRTTDDLLRDALAACARTPDGTCDIVPQLAVKLPTWVLFEMMGVPERDRGKLVELTDTAFDDSDEGPAAAQARTVAHTEIFAYFMDLLDQRRGRPGTDIVSSLAQHSAGGRALTDDEVILNCDGLVNGGLETTPHAISGAFLAFAEHPAAWRRVKENPELIDTAVEEILRWTSPPMHALRTAAADTTIGSATIAQGDQVVIWLPSCNRDEAVFADPDRFLIDRRPNPHLCFGVGPHHCVAALLARVELRLLLTAMTRLIATIEVSGEVARKRSNFLNGLSRLDVRLTPQPALSPLDG